MNTPLKQRIDEKLDRFSERRVAEVLDFVEFLENRDRAAASAARDADHSGVSLAGMTPTLNEWSGEAREQAVETRSQRIEAALALMREIIQSPPKGKLGPPFLDLTGFKFNRDEANAR
jgi:hypothetical protein